MKNIINWTLGGFFRSLGRILSFIVIGGLITILIYKSGIKLPDWLNPLYIVNAEEINYTYKQYRVQFYDLGTGVSNWTTYSNFNTSTTISSGYGVSGIAVRFGSSTKFKTGKKYRVIIDIAWQPEDVLDYTAKNVDHTNCLGTLTTSNWSADASRIDSCDYIGYSLVPNSTRLKYVYDIVPSVDIEGLQFNIYFTGTSEVTYINVKNTSTISTGEDITGAINEQNIIIQNNFDNIENIINQNNQELLDIITQNNETCTSLNIDRNTNGMSRGSLSSNGTISVASNNYSITKYYSITENTTIKALRTVTVYSCFYDSEKVVISCFRGSGNTATDIGIPSNAKYVRFSILNTTGYTYYTFNKCQTNTQSTNDVINDLNDTLNDTDSSSESSWFSDYIHDFNLSIEGPLSAIITLPINMLQNLIIDYNDNNIHADLCTTFNGTNICLPSGDIIWKRSGVHDNSYYPFGIPNYSAFKTFFQLVAGGFIYWHLLRRLVKTAEKGLDPSESGVNLLKL